MKKLLTPTLYLHKANHGAYQDSIFMAQSDCSATTGYPLLGTVTLEFEFDMPSEQEQTLAEIKMLEAAKNAIAKDAAERIGNMQDRLNSLLAIENHSKEGQ